MSTTSQTISYQRVVTYLPLHLVSQIDSEVGLNGISRTEVIRRWLQMVWVHKNKGRQ